MQRNTAISRVAAYPSSYCASHDPKLLQSRGKHAGAALTEIIETAAAVDAAHAGLETVTAAIARGPNDRSDHLRT